MSFLVDSEGGILLGARLAMLDTTLRLLRLGTAEVDGTDLRGASGTIVLGLVGLDCGGLIFAANHAVLVDIQLKSGYGLGVEGQRAFDIVFGLLNGWLLRARRDAKRSWLEGVACDGARGVGLLVELSDILLAVEPMDNVRLLGVGGKQLVLELGALKVENSAFGMGGVDAFMAATIDLGLFLLRLLFCQSQDIIVINLLIRNLNRSANAILERLHFVGVPLDQREGLIAFGLNLRNHGLDRRSCGNLTIARSEKRWLNSRFDVLLAIYDVLGLR